MQTAKSHRVVACDYAAVLSTLLSASAVESAENEGWPIPAAESDLPPALCFASEIRHVADRFARHANEELPFRPWPMPAHGSVPLRDHRTVGGAEVLQAAR